MRSFCICYLKGWLNYVDSLWTVVHSHISWTITQPHPGYWIRIFPTQILDPNFSIPDPGSASNNLSILTNKIVFWTLGNMIRVVHPGSGSCFFTHLGSQIQRSKRHRTPNPDPQQCTQLNVSYWDDNPTPFLDNTSAHIKSSLADSMMDQRFFFSSKGCEVGEHLQELGSRADPVTLPSAKPANHIPVWTRQPAWCIMSLVSLVWVLLSWGAYLACSARAERSACMRVCFSVRASICLPSSSRSASSLPKRICDWKSTPSCVSAT